MENYREQFNLKLRIVVYAPKDGKNAISDENIQVFCESKIAVKPGENILSFVDGVIDSSRYFVIRVQDPSSSRSTMVGIGFRERDVAFDFKNSLNEYVRYVERMDLAARMATEAEQQPSDEERSSASPALLQHIKPLEEGVKMKLNIKSLSHHSAAKAEEEEAAQMKPKKTTSSSSSSGSLLIKIKGPPSAAIQATTTSTTTPTPLPHHHHSSSPELPPLPPAQTAPTITFEGSRDDEDEFGN